MRLLDLRFLLLPAVTTVLATLPACGGTVDDGSEPSAARGPSSGPPAKEGTPVDEATRARLAEVCDGVPGLTGQAVLDVLEKNARTLSATFGRWVYPPGPPKKDHETKLEVGLRFENGAVRCTPATPDPPGTPNPSVTPAAVEIVVKVTFRTADGLFDEVFDAPFKLVDAGSSSGVSFKTNVPVDAFKGTYRAIAEADKAGATKPVLFFGTIHWDSIPHASYGGVVHGGEAFGHFAFE